MKRISDSKYQYAHKNKKFDSEKSKQEGTDFHQYCQNYLEGNTNYNKYVPSEKREMFRVFMKELDKIKPVKTECVLYSHENRFAGRADVIGSYEKQLCLIDFRFTRTPQNKSESECELACLQTAAYACQEMTGSKIQDLVIIFGFIPNDNETKPRVQIVKLSLMKKFNYEILIEKFLKEKSKYELVKIYKI